MLSVPSLIKTLFSLSAPLGLRKDAMHSILRLRGYGIPVKIGEYPKSLLRSRIINYLLKDTKIVRRNLRLKIIERFCRCDVFYVMSRRFSLQITFTKRVTVNTVPRLQRAKSCAVTEMWNVRPGKVVHLRKITDQGLNSSWMPRNNGIKVYGQPHVILPP